MINPPVVLLFGDKDKAEAYRGRGHAELAILKHQMQFNALTEGKRQVSLGPEVNVVCTSSYGLDLVLITVVPHKEEKVDKEAEYPYGEEALLVAWSALARKSYWVFITKDIAEQSSLEARLLSQGRTYVTKGTVTVWGFDSLLDDNSYLAIRESMQSAILKVRHSTAFDLVFKGVGSVQDKKIRSLLTDQGYVFFTSPVYKLTHPTNILNDYTEAGLFEGDFIVKEGGLFSFTGKSSYSSTTNVRNLLFQTYVLGLTVEEYSGEERCFINLTGNYTVIDWDSMAGVVWDEDFEQSISAATTLGDEISAVTLTENCLLALDIGASNLSVTYQFWLENTRTRVLYEKVGNCIPLKLDVAMSGLTVGEITPHLTETDMSKAYCTWWETQEVKHKFNLGENLMPKNYYKKEYSSNSEGEHNYSVVSYSTGAYILPIAVYSVTGDISVLRQITVTREYPCMNGVDDRWHTYDGNCL